MAIMALMVAAISVMVWVALNLRPAAGEGFYAYLSHNLMVAIFAPAFLLPLALIGVGLRRYWKDTGGSTIPMSDLGGAFGSVARLKKLARGPRRRLQLREGGSLIERPPPAALNLQNIEDQAHPFRHQSWKIRTRRGNISRLLKMCR